jgi:cytochrome P450
MTAEARTLSWWDTLRFQLLVTVPYALWGPVTANRWFVSQLSSANAGQATIRFLDALRDKYRSDHLWAWFPGGRTLLVLNPESIDAVLQSDQNAADPMLKKRALSHFVPDALVISSGHEWANRRPFNETVLALGKLHPHADAFKEIAFQEVDRLTAERSAALRWADFQTLAERISHQVLLGPGRVEPELTRHLARMVRRSNWVVLPRHRRSFSAFYEQIGRYLARHRAGITGAVPTHCLMHESAALLEDGSSATDLTQVPRQIGFWVFVLKDALELHVARTLALIAAHPEVQDGVRKEIRNLPAMTARTIDGLQYLDACVHEALRLWTPVPILLRRAVTSFTLRPRITIEPGQQILIHAGYYHRDSRVFGESTDRFSPDSVRKDGPHVYFFSRHRQSCAGQSLATFLIKGTLAALLARHRFELVGPTVGPGRIPYLYDHFKILLRSLGDA